VREKIFGKHVEPAPAQMLLEDMEFMGPVPPPHHRRRPRAASCRRVRRLEEGGKNHDPSAASVGTDDELVG